ARPVPVARDHSAEEAGEDQRQRTGPIPIRQPRMPEDDEFKAAYELLRLLDRAQRAEPDAPFIQTQSGDILHPALHEGRISVPAALFNRLIQESLIRVLAGVYHRRGPDVGREFVITQAGHDMLARR